MNANNVYIGLTLDNEEILLYRESSDKIINLMTKEYVEPSDIQLDKDKLIPYTRLKESKHQLKGTIIRTFEKDRSEKLDVRNIFIGSILQTTDYKFVKGYGYVLPMMYWSAKYHISSQIIKEKALLYRIKKGCELSTLSGGVLYESKFIDLETGIRYSNKNYSEVGGFFVAPKMTPYLSVVEYDGPMEEKRMVLKKYRERRGK